MRREGLVESYIKQAPKETHKTRAIMYAHISNYIIHAQHMGAPLSAWHTSSCHLSPTQRLPTPTTQVQASFSKGKPMHWNDAAF